LHVLRHYTRRLRTTLRLVAALEIVSRTSELARVFGIDFHSVRCLRTLLSLFPYPALSYPTPILKDQAKP
jgi:hypothetical protein